MYIYKDEFPARDSHIPVKIPIATNGNVFGPLHYSAGLAV